MAVQKVSRAFKDISLSFEPHPITKDLPILKNEAAIRRAVRNLVETIPTERFFNSLLGSDIQSSLFEFVDYASASAIQNQILTTIRNFEPRVSGVQVEANPVPDLNAFDITISFEIIGQDIAPQTFTFILEATR